MTQEEAKAKFSNIKQFEGPVKQMSDAKRFTDDEAGVVFWGFVGEDGVDNYELHIESMPLSETELEADE